MSEVEVASQDTDQIGAAISAYLDTKTNPNTKAAYRRDLDAWVMWCRETGTQHSSIGPYATYLQDQAMSNATIARKLSVISGLFRYLRKLGYDTPNPVELVDRPKVSDESQTDGLTKDQVTAILNAADKESPRNAALIYLLVFTGCRVSEGLSADIEDLGTEEGMPYVNVARKGGRTQKLLVPGPAIDRIRKYLATRDDYTSVPMTRDDAARPARRVLFATATGGRMFRQDVPRILARLADAAGLPDDQDITPHVLRHSFVTHSLDAGYALHHVQDAVGHSSPVTTQRYNRARNRLANSPGNTLGDYYGVSK